VDTRPDSWQTGTGSGSSAAGDDPRFALPSLDPAAVQAAVQAYARVAAVAPDFAPHTQLAYEQVATLGEGGMGVVLRMKDRRLGREVAVKLIRGTPSARRVRRFRREALLTASLEHPAIPPVYETGTTADGQPYLAMRLIEGKPLSTLIQEHHQRRSRADTDARARRQRRLLEALLKVAEAVAYAHEQGVIHRDLKPDNVMVGRHGEVMLMDWGLAKRIDEPDEGASQQEQVGALTMEGTFLGTMGYAAPEQARGRSDPRADVFALGAMLTEILTGKLPLGGSGSKALMDLAEGRIATPAQLGVRVPPELDSIASSALAYDVNVRTPSVEAFADSLRAWLAGEDVPEHRYGALEQLSRTVRRRPALVVTALGVLILLFGAGVAGAVVAESRRLRLAAEAQQRETEQARELALAGEREAEATRAQFERAMELLAEAGSLLQRGKTEEGLAKIDEALGGQPPRFLAWHAARICQEGRAYGRAKQLLEAMIADYPPGVKELYQLHRVEAEETDQVVGSMTPALQRLLEVVGEEENPFTLVAQAVAADNEKRHQEAIDLATRAIELDGSLGQAYNVRGAARHGMGDTAGAVEDLRMAVALEPQHVLAWRNLAYGLLVLKQTAEATQAIDRCLAIKRTAGAHNIRGNILQELKLWDEAIREYDRVLKVKPEDFAVIRNRGNAKLQAGRPGEALEDYDASVRLQPGFVGGHSARALALKKLLRLSEAEEALTTALRLTPDDEDFHVRRALLRAQQRRFALAIEDMDRALELAPDHENAKNWRSLRARMTRDLQKQQQGD
jgi:serine/threonine protein kinase/tetratricopeptide (TPR) repeat protein